MLHRTASTACRVFDGGNRAAARGEIDYSPSRVPRGGKSTQNENFAHARASAAQNQEAP
jgi:hypothetical protein